MHSLALRSRSAPPFRVIVRWEFVRPIPVSGAPRVRLKLSRDWGGLARAPGRSGPRAAPGGHVRNWRLLFGPCRAPAGPLTHRSYPALRAVIVGRDSLGRRETHEMFPAYQKRASVRRRSCGRDREHPSIPGLRLECANSGHHLSARQTASSDRCPESRD